MAKKLDEATRLLIESLPENLQKLAFAKRCIGKESEKIINDFFTLGQFEFAK